MRIGLAVRVVLESTSGPGAIAISQRATNSRGGAENAEKKEMVHNQYSAPPRLCARSRYGSCATHKR